MYNNLEWIKYKCNRWMYFGKRKYIIKFRALLTYNKNNNIKYLKIIIKTIYSYLTNIIIINKKGFQGFSINHH